jgi:malectin (di-glucose binding ER protein)
MSLEVVTLAHSNGAPVGPAGGHQELVRRVASSATLEKSPRLRAFFIHVCKCSLEGRADEATEQQIGIYVYGRPASYNPNDDNIVRSQARMLRMKLEHHFANEGKDELVIITIPKGQYLPVFENRSSEPGKPASDGKDGDRGVTTRHRIWFFVAMSALLGLIIIWLGYHVFQPKSSSAPSSIALTGASSPASEPEPARQSQKRPVVSAPDIGEIRIAAGHMGASYVDVWGHRWDADRCYEGGVARPGPLQFFPPVADEGPLRSLRQAASGDDMVPQAEREFHYNIPLGPGVYELRLYFADPLRQQATGSEDDSQNERHFHVTANGHPLLTDLDPIADAGAAAVDVRVFKDVRAAADGKLHLDFGTDWGQPAFVSAIELTPGIPGRLKPIRISAIRSDFINTDGIRWSGDNYFISGRTFANLKPASGVPGLYTGERHGNFSYAIPVTPGSYTLRLYFMESFFSPVIRAADCHGAGCRVFDVTCNGVMLLQDFDVFQAAGAFHPVVREFHGMHPNGQGKLLISFSPKVNYAEVRAIEVIDEAK